MLPETFLFSFQFIKTIEVIVLNGVFKSLTNKIFKRVVRIFR